MASTLFLSRPYRLPVMSFDVETEDGVHLRGHRLGKGDDALVFCHGFLGWHRKARLVRFQEELARTFAVYAFDFRGHGQSAGVSRFGAVEHRDVAAVVDLARRQSHHHVVTFGGSMGGIAVIRHGALMGGIDGIVAVSTPAGWDGHASVAVRRIARLSATPSGRWFLRRLGARLAPDWSRVDPPAEVVGAISPTPLLIVHGRDDHFFDEEQAWLLYRRAASPKRLLLASRFGHAEDGYTPAFAGLISRAVRAMVS